MDKAVSIVAAATAGMDWYTAAPEADHSNSSCWRSGAAPTQRSEEADEGCGRGHSDAAAAAADSEDHDEDRNLCRVDCSSRGAGRGRASVSSSALAPAVPTGCQGAYRCSGQRSGVDSGSLLALTFWTFWSGAVEMLWMWSIVWIKLSP